MKSQLRNSYCGLVGVLSVLLLTADAISSPAAFRELSDRFCERTMRIEIANDANPSPSSSADEGILNSHLVFTAAFDSGASQCAKDSVITEIHRGTTTSRKISDRGRIIKLTDLGGEIFRYTYDADGQLRRVKRSGSAKNRR